MLSEDAVTAILERNSSRKGEKTRTLGGIGFIGVLVLCFARSFNRGHLSSSVLIRLSRVALCTHRAPLLVGPCAGHRQGKLEQISPLRSLTETTKGGAFLCFLPFPCRFDLGSFFLPPIPLCLFFFALAMQ